MEDKIVLTKEELEKERKKTVEKILYALADTLTNEVVTRENICYFIKSFADFYELETDFSFMNSQNNSALK